MGENAARAGELLPTVYGRGLVRKLKEIVYRLCPVVTRDVTMEAMRQVPQTIERDGLRYTAGADRPATEEALVSVREWLGQHGRTYQGVS